MNDFQVHSNNNEKWKETKMKHTQTMLMVKNAGVYFKCNAKCTFKCHVMNHLIFGGMHNNNNDNSYQLPQTHNEHYLILLH